MTTTCFSQGTPRALIVAGPAPVVAFPKAKEWFNFRNAKDDSADLYIFDVVGDSWAGNDAATLVKAIKAQKGKKLNVHISSPGGSVFDGVAIFNALKTHDSIVTVYIDGLAASIASIIALAGSKVIMADNAMMMIHNPLCYAFGTAPELRKQADVLDQIKETLVNTYEAKTKKDRKTISADMDAETWFTAKEALAYGLVDELTGASQIAACVSPEIANIFGFTKTPDKVVKPEAVTTSFVPRSVLSRKLALQEKQVS